MNKRSIIITLIIAMAVCVLLVVGAVLIWNFWLANSPSVQSWIHDWLENPVGLTASATVALAFTTFALTLATFSAVMVALYGTRYEQRKAREDRLEGQRQLQDALHAANRPLLVPVAYEQELEMGMLGINILKGTFHIHNEGTGIATNVVGGCIYSDSLTIRRIASSIFKEEFKELKLQDETVLDCQDVINGYEICSGKDDTYRLVITYHDIFRRKHASIFDGYFEPGLEPPEAKWTCIAFMDDIPFDLDEMIENRKSKSK